MPRTHDDWAALWDSVLPEEMLRLPAELARVLLKRWGGP
jgi:hypothetical protein